MTTSAGSGPPPEAVLFAFGLSGSPVALPGGQATAWRAGAGVLKPSDVPPSVIAWQARLLAGVDGRPDFRVSVPLQAVDCSWTVEGLDGLAVRAGQSCLAPLARHHCRR